jgi:hypothetical protein
MHVLLLWLSVIMFDMLITMVAATDVPSVLRIVDLTFPRNMDVYPIFLGICFPVWVNSWQLTDGCVRSPSVCLKGSLFENNF